VQVHVHELEDDNLEIIITEVLFHSDRGRETERQRENEAVEEIDSIGWLTGQCFREEIVC
jgi:hypothetical protein